MITHSKPFITQDDLTRVQDVLITGDIARGKKVAQFEADLARHLGAKQAFATSSGTSALILGLKSLGIEKGDDVIIPTYVCSNVMYAVKNAGATPVLCDIGNEWNLTAEKVKQKISSRTKAIVIVHIYGIPADIKGIKELGFPVIEDCCQAIGAKYDGKLTGSYSDIAFYSFHATKLLTTGEGGALTAGTMEMSDHVNEILVENQIAFPMTDIQAALGISQLRKYNNFLEARYKIASRYFENISANKVKLPDSIRDKSIFFRFPLTIEDLDFDNVLKRYKENGINVRHGVDSLLHRMLGESDSEYPNAVNAFNNTLSIPLYPALTEDEQEKIIMATNKILS